MKFEIQVKSHEFFATLNWDELLTNKALITTHFETDIKGMDDAADNFDSDRKWSLGNLTFMDIDSSTMSSDQNDVRVPRLTVWPWVLTCSLQGDFKNFSFMSLHHLGDKNKEERLPAISV